MRRVPALAVGLGLTLLLAFTLPAEAAWPPDVADRPNTQRVQSVVDGLLKIKEVKQAFEDGDTLVVVVNDSRWHGTVAAGKVDLSEGNLPGATHTLRVDPNAMLSIINAYDQGNTAKLAVKRQYMTAHSERAAVNLAIGAIARTPADARLATYDPAVGKTISYHGCTNDPIFFRDDQTGVLVATHCGIYGILIDPIGGVIGTVPAQHLSAVALASLNLSVSLRVFDSAAFSLSSDLIEEAEDAVEEDGEEMDEENAKKKAKKAAKAVKNGRRGSS